MKELKTPAKEDVNAGKTIPDNMIAPISLSHREKQMTALAAAGLTSGEIARSLNISKPTVEKHRNNVIRKLSAANMIEAVAIAMRNGWIE